MKKYGCILLLTALSICFTGCKTVDDEVVVISPFEKMEIRMTEISDDGDFAAIGTGRSRNDQIAFEMAKQDARENLEKVILESAENTAEQKEVTRRLIGLIPEDQKVEKNGDIYTAKVLLRIGKF